MSISNFRFLCSIGFIFGMFSCQNSSTEVNIGNIDIKWTLESIDVTASGYSQVTSTITNNLDHDLTADNWKIFYNHVGGQVAPQSMPGEITITNANGDLFELSPTKEFISIPSGASRSYSYKITGFLDKISEAPMGMFIVIDGNPRAVNLVTTGIDENTLSPLNPTTAATRFLDNARLTLLSKDELLPYIPRPSFHQYLSEVKILGSVVSYSASTGIEREIEFLKDGLSSLGITLKKESGESDITLAIEQTNDPSHEAYELRVDQSGINITAYSKSGIFYGIQSLLQYLQYAKLEDASDQLSVRGVDIRDQPRFDYRGMHLDVARNFHSIKSVKRLMDAMAFFKLNKFHFHITDDEGWRLEIPGLPELIEVGSKRGYSKDESDKLMPSYGSGFELEDSNGSGYYSREEYIDLLKYANDRHIEVITEIDVPGHARAAIKSMLSRYNRLMEAGDEEAANYYRLDDPDDKSEYSSAQNWHDGVICLCRPGAYNFMDKVFTELVEMYREANVPITALHIGGDEMPYGAWQKSPMCDEFIQQTPEISSSNDLPAYFMNRMKEITSRFNLTTAGWEEMVIAHDEKGHNSTQIDLSLLGHDVRPYVWNAIIGAGRDDMIYKLANAGFKVVMSNSSAFYFDMAYDKDPDEIGLSWSGYANTETSFGTEPLDLFYRHPVDGNGEPLSKEYLNSRESLTSNGEHNFLGIQCQLWSETIVEESAIEYLVFPKMLGFAERAWSPRGRWMNETDIDQIDAIYKEEWNLFANTVGQKALPMLDQFSDGIGYRIPEPGAIIEDGRLIANTAFPGLPIRFVEGGETRTYQGPVAVNNPDVSLWSEGRNGRKGRKTQVQ